MLAEYHASLDARELSLPLETNSKKFEISNFSVGQENLQNNKDEFRNLQTILEHIENLIDSENRKGMLRNIKTEFEHTFQSTDIHVLQDYLHSLYNTKTRFLSVDIQSRCLFYLITYHVLVASEIENSTQILNLIKDKLHGLCRYDFHLECIFQLYLDVYYKNNPNEVFTNIHTIWKCENATEFNLQLAYCENLIEAKDYKTLLQLIHCHADDFIKSYEENEHQLHMFNGSTVIMVLLHILHHLVSLNKTKRVKSIETILSGLQQCYDIYNEEHFLFSGFNDFILTLDNTQILYTPYVIKLLQPLAKEQPLDYLKFILSCSYRLRQANHYTECMKFIKCHFQFILSFPTDKLTIKGACYNKKQYGTTLLLLLNEYVYCHDTHKTKLVVTKIQELFFLSDIHNISFYCFMGNEECMTSLEKHLQYFPLMKHESNEGYIDMDDFQQHLLYIYDEKLCRILIPSVIFEFRLALHHDFNLVRNKVIQGKYNPASYLKSIIEMMEINEYKVESVVSFIEFIKRSADYNVASLYKFIKKLCAFELKPEIEDMILQGLTEYLMISGNKPYGSLSKFILDINMIFTKDQFLHKLTSCIAKSLLKFDDDTVKHFNNIIYKCYCTLRHDSKNEKDTYITEYKEHFTFIASMEAEEEMKKLTNFLLMLTLLLITSGGHHKSAALKKYLSLKYEYRDSILYLLWCSGDVEINPGPTFRTLRKIPDSVKERNWIYEMCSILVRLLKYRSLDLKNGGLWKEKPLHWPPEWPFYDPRNKPRGEGYDTGTDYKLLKCLEEHCHSKGFFNSTSQFDDEQTQFKVEQYQKEITAWKNNRTELFELYTLRQELDTLRAAKESLHKYMKDSELHQGISDLNVDFIFDTDNVTSISSEGYTDTVRDIAITFCRIGKGLSPLEKSDGIWKTPPSGWTPNDSYFSPCNAGKRKEKGQDQKLVDNLLTYCKSKKKAIPAELQPLFKAWKLRNTSEITKSYTIWSKTAIIKHSLQCLQLEGMLEKINVQESLKQIGVILDMQHWRCPSINKSCTRDNDDKSKDLHSSSSSDIEINSTASIQINSDNPCTQLSNSTQTNSKDTPASPHSLVSHTDGHLCNTASDQPNQLNQSSKHTRVNSFKDSCPILTSKAQPEAGGNYQPISTVNSLTSKGEVIPCTVHIHDTTSKTDSNNKISKTAKKRGKQKIYESPSEPKRLHISEEDVPLLLTILISPSENGKVLSNTKRTDGDIRPISPYQFPHDLISIQSRLNPLATEKQTDQLVVKDLTDIASDKPEDPSLPQRQDGEVTKANKNKKTTSDQYVGKLVDLLEELDQDYSSAVVQQTIPISCSSTHQSSDSSDELPEAIQLCIDTYLNSYNPDDTLETDIEQFIEEQGMDSS